MHGAAAETAPCDIMLCNRLYIKACGVCCTANWLGTWQLAVAAGSRSSSFSADETVPAHHAFAHPVMPTKTLIDEKSGRCERTVTLTVPNLQN